MPWYPSAAAADLAAREKLNPNRPLQQPAITDPVVLEPGNWMVGPNSAWRSWPRDETTDPCFDFCSQNSQNGAIAGGTTLANKLDLSGGGLWWFEWALAFFGNGGGQGLVCQAILTRDLSAAVPEVCGMLSAGDATNADHCVLVCRVMNQARLSLVTQNATGVGTIAFSLFRAKRISR